MELAACVPDSDTPSVQGGWGGPELIFRNDWAAAVLIKRDAGTDSITVRFFSSRFERLVETETLPPSGTVAAASRSTTRGPLTGSTLIKAERFRVRYGVSSCHGH